MGPPCLSGVETQIDSSGLTNDDDVFSLYCPTLHGTFTLRLRASVHASAPRMKATLKLDFPAV
jgi:hypothetical protein